MRTGMLAAFALILAVAGLAAGCSDATDDPGISGNLVTVSGVDPTEACIDVDGELVDLDGDGTEETVFTSTENSINFTSTLRGSSSGDFKDVLFTSMDVVYVITAGPVPPNRLNELISIEVPAGGSADFGMTTVEAQDIIDGFFTGATEGSVRVTFRGADLSGEPASTTAQMPIRAVSVCEGQ